MNAIKSEPIFTVKAGLIPTGSKSGEISRENVLAAMFESFAFRRNFWFRKFPADFATLIGEHLYFDRLIRRFRFAYPTAKIRMIGNEPEE